MTGSTSGRISSKASRAVSNAIPTQFTMSTVVCGASLKQIDAAAAVTDGTPVDPTCP